MRRLRYLPPNTLVEVTCRTFQSLYLLTPSARTREIILGVLGRAQRRYGMEIHAPVFTSNHYHLLLSPSDSLQLARFMGYLNSNIAREIGRQIGWRDKFWSRRYQAIPVAEDEESQVGRLHYLLAHGVKEGLVGQPEEWPGVHAVGNLLRGEPLRGTWFDRSLEYEARRSRNAPKAVEFGSPEELTLSPLPIWRELSAEQRRARILWIVQAITEEARLDHFAAGTKPAGASAVLRQDVRSRPAATKRSPAPWVHAASQAVRAAWKAAYREFAAAFRDAAEQLRAGNRLALFPEGSFPPSLPWVPIPGS